MIPEPAPDCFTVLSSSISSAIFSCPTKCSRSVCGRNQNQEERARAGGPPRRRGRDTVFMSLNFAADPEPSPPELRGPARHLLREAGCYSLCVHRAQRLQAHGSAPRLHCWPPHQVSSQTLLIPARFSDAECLLLAVPPGSSRNCKASSICYGQTLQ